MLLLLPELLLHRRPVHTFDFNTATQVSSFSLVVCLCASELCLMIYIHEHMVNYSSWLITCRCTGPSRPLITNHLVLHPTVYMIDRSISLLIEVSLDWISKQEYLFFRASQDNHRHPWRQLLRHHQHQWIRVFSPAIKSWRERPWIQHVRSLEQQLFEVTNTHHASKAIASFLMSNVNFYT
jgi:hypothetical protein